MNTEKENLDPKQSLELITSMINQAKGNMQNGSFYFLLWGWVITLCNLGMYYLFKYTEYKQYAPLVWTLSIPAWIITIIYANRQEKKAGMLTHLDRISMWLWIGMAITILPAWIFGAQTNWMVNAIILMPVGMATFLSGIIIRFRPLILGGITFWIAGILCYIVGPIEQYLVGAVAIVFGHLVPGYLLKKANCSCKN
jgi:hypothetical protein